MRIELEMIEGARRGLVKAIERAKLRYEAADSPQDARRARLQADALIDAVKASCGCGQKKSG